MIKHLLFVFVVVLMGSFASAEMPAGKALTFADFKLSCQNPQQFQAQRPPEGIKIVCKDVRYTWVPVAAGQVRMATTPRTVTGELFSDKYHVSIEQKSMACAEAVGACSRFKEVGQKVETERAVTCDEILQFTGGLHEFCATATDQLIASNASAAQVYDTGRVMDTCGAPAAPAVIATEACADRDAARDRVERDRRDKKKHDRD